MLQSKPDNLLDVDTLINAFIKKHQQGIVTMQRIHLRDTNEISIRALIEELTEELRTGCVTFINKNDEMEELDSYLFYIANAFYKKKATATAQVKKKTNYMCPGCLFLNKSNPVISLNKIFKCDECETELKLATDPKSSMFYRTFFRHNKNGYHCQDCDRFIPHPIDESPIVSCPYYDCIFVGSWLSLKRMHHPTAQSNIECLSLDFSKEGGSSFKDMIASDDVNALSRLEIKEELENKIISLREIIDSQRNTIPYSSSDFTVIHKSLAYQAFDNLIKKFPSEMISYLLEQSRSGGFQHKVFQEYIRLLEESLPFSFKKNKKVYKIETLLDNNINLFDGISMFEATISDKLSIKNNTKEFYIGGRKAAYTKPYYIGKLLSAEERNNKKSLIDFVKEYSFSNIKMKDVAPGTEVIVTHLRVPPHYQMGGMVYINRVRKKIVDRAQLILSKGSDD